MPHSIISNGGINGFGARREFEAHFEAFVVFLQLPHMTPWRPTATKDTVRWEWRPGRRRATLSVIPITLDHSHFPRSETPTPGGYSFPCGEDSSDSLDAHLNLGLFPESHRVPMHLVHSARCPPAGNNAWQCNAVDALHSFTRMQTPSALEFGWWIQRLFWVRPSQRRSIRDLRWLAHPSGGRTADTH